MLHYQISPPKKVNAKLSEDVENNRPVHLYLGQFSSIPKLHFGSVTLGNTYKKILYVRNPLPEPCTVRLSKKPSKHFTTTFNTDVIIPGTSQIDVEFSWTPKEAGTIFESCQFHSTNTSVGLSVHLMGVCTAPIRRNKFRGPARPQFKNPAVQNVQKSQITLPKSPNITKPKQPESNGVQIAREIDAFNTLVRSQETTNGDGDEPSKVIVQENNVDIKVDVEQKEERSQTPTDASSLNSMLDSIAFLTPEVSSRKTPLRSNTVVIRSHDLPNAERGDEFSTKDKEVLKTELTATNSPLNLRRETYLVGPNSAVPTPVKPTSQQQQQQNPTRNKKSARPPVPSFFKAPAAEPLHFEETNEKINETYIASDLTFVHNSLDNLIAPPSASDHKRKISENEIDSDDNIDDLDSNSNISTKFDLTPAFSSNEKSIEETDFVKKLISLIRNDTPLKDILAEKPKNTFEEVKKYFVDFIELYNSYRHAFSLTKKVYESEEYILKSLMIREAIKNGELRLTKDINGFEEKEEILSKLMATYHLPYLWSAVSLTMNQAIEKDFSSILNFLESSLYWDKESAETFGYEEKEMISMARVGDEFTHKLNSNFLKNYLEIIYLLDSLSFPGVFIDKCSTKSLLDSFVEKYLEKSFADSETINEIKINIQNPEIILSFNYIMTQFKMNEICHWMHFAYIVQEIIGCPFLYYCNLDDKSECIKCIQSAFAEIKGITGDEINLSEKEAEDVYLGKSDYINENFIWKLYLLMRVKHLKN